MLHSYTPDPLQIRSSGFTVSLARCEEEVAETQRLRYQVFAEELGARIPNRDGRDIDCFDAFCQHLLVREERSGQVVGSYRLLTAQGACNGPGWYSESEFDLSRLHHLLPRTVELGRACVRRDCRSGGIIALLWAGLAQFMQLNRLEYMIGCGSLSVADGGHFAASMFRMLEENHYAPEEYRVFPKNPLPLHLLRQDLPAQCPALIKGYLRAGAYICGAPHLDEDFHCADVLVMMPMARLNRRYARHFVK